MALDLKPMAASELARIVWNSDEPMHRRLEAVIALERQLDRLMASFKQQQQQQKGN
jgi:hypothetical protein